MSDTVTKERELTSKSGMNLFGWLMFLGMIILLIPLLPIYIALKLWELVTGGKDNRGRPKRRRRATG